MNLSYVRGFLSIGGEKVCSSLGISGNLNCPEEDFMTERFGQCSGLRKDFLPLDSLPGLKVVGIFEVIHSLITIQVPTTSTGKVGVRKEMKKHGV